LLETVTIVLALMLAASTPTASALVLRHGGTIPIREIVDIRDGRIFYLDRGGILYSVDEDEVDLSKTESSPSPRSTRAGSPASEERPKRLDLAVSPEERDRLISEFARTARRGIAPPDLPSESRATNVEQEEKEPSPTPKDENYWRSNARALRASVERSEQALASAKERERTLSAQILFFAGRSGDASEYSYLVRELEDVRSSIKSLEDQVVTSRRQLAEFLDRARTEDVLPGWLR